MLANTGARTRVNLHSSVCFPSLIKTSSNCGLSQLLDVLVEQLVEVSSGSCSSVSQHVFRKVRMSVSVRGWISHRAGPTQHLRVWQTASVEVGHGGCVGFLCGLFCGRKRQGNVSFVQSGVGRFGYGWRRGFFCFYNFLGWWGRSSARFFWGCRFFFGGRHSSLDSGLYLSVRSTSFKKKKIFNVFFPILLSPLTPSVFYKFFWGC